MSASKDILIFRRALLNPSTSQHFRKYISAKGETLENDVLFWHEVQKYKVTFNINTQETCYLLLRSIM